MELAKCSTFFHLGLRLYFPRGFPGLLLSGCCCERHRALRAQQGGGLWARSERLQDAWVGALSCHFPVGALELPGCSVESLLSWWRQLHDTAWHHGHVRRRDCWIRSAHSKLQAMAEPPQTPRGTGLRGPHVYPPETPKPNCLQIIPSFSKWLPSYPDFQRFW